MFIGIPLVLLATVFILLPYRTDIMAVDRSRGSRINKTCYFHIWCVVTSPSDLGLSAFGVATRPELLLPELVHVRRFIWSTGGTWVPVQPGSAIGDVLNEIYYPVTLSHNGQLLFSREEQRAILRRRLTIWNSEEVDSNPLAVSARLKEENETLVKQRLASLVKHLP
jgi:hypothetical protein